MGEIEERNKALAREFLEVLSRGDVDRARELYADDFEIWTAGSLPFSGRSGKEQALEGMPMVLGLFPKGLAFSVVGLTAEGERVAIEAESRGTSAGGKEYRQQYHFLLRARDGRIVEFKEYMDTEHAREVLVEGAGG